MWVEQTKDGRFKYIERYTDPYTEKTRKKSTTLTSESPQAWKKAQKIIDKKIQTALEDYDKSDISFGKLYAEWFKYYKQHVKRTSYLKVPLMMKHVSKHISDDTIVRNIDESLIYKIIEDMYTFGELSLNYTKQTKTTLSVMLNYAVEKNYITRNPALSVKIQPKKVEEDKRKLAMDKKYLEKEEIDKILKQLYSNPRRKLHGIIAEFLYLTGLRYGELIALQMKDYKDGTISINGTLDYSFVKMDDAVKTTPKNSYSRREVQLSDRAKELIDELIADNILSGRGNEAEDYIFVSSNDTPLTLHAFNAVLHKVEEELELEKSLSSHIFRHSHVSLLSELGVPLKAIMERVGHSDANTTLSIYNHVTKKSKQQVIDKLNSL
ncbi:tyrosine-type recombinase/integrase [Enterococcus gilvus]|uniref:Site-specific tyrosine recombinase XerC-family n=1 Tax=Enterococcus gilvus ATCC BAA-350 TaxID=1158614 RepID=R2Y547_9ENTE|nr:site-specific integrase [Enterococcus gilvus]EOI57447.1 site-specific tyrosine recombinase XerC-family [Enterococcus gilvus ATCC BAA-350]EOW82979.1 site-specific tyrosine recombinase XerC-family [Enterococcus gilvus ATCC BAA-350]OJG40858.1 site-specific tyrosine recombinase XerC-family [Enterococcus gilvus]